MTTFGVDPTVAASRYANIASLYRERAAAITSPAEAAKLVRLADIYDQKVRGLNQANTRAEIDVIYPTEIDVTYPSDGESPAAEKAESAPERRKLFQFADPKRRPRLGPNQAVHGSD